MKIYNTPEFKECNICAKKAGSPILCSSCINNRSAISELKRQRDKLRKLVEIAQDVLDID